jgi:hypothetical protein
MASQSSNISLPSTIASTTTIGDDAIPWEYIQSNQSLNSWLGPVPQRTHPSILTSEFPLPSQREFYRNRPVYKMLRPPACYMAIMGILRNEAPTWMGLTLPRIKEDTNLSSRIVLAFEFHPFVIFSSRCLRLVHSALTEKHRRDPIPVYAEPPPESGFPGGSKFDIYFTYLTVTSNLSFEPTEEMYYLLQHIWICSDALSWLRHIRRAATPIIRTMGLAATAECLVGPARRYMEWAGQAGQNVLRIENLVQALCAGFARHPGAFLHDEHFRQLERNIEVWLLLLLILECII